jgi:hypothetical protein
MEKDYTKYNTGGVLRAIIFHLKRAPRGKQRQLGLAQMVMTSHVAMISK